MLGRQVMEAVELFDYKCTILPKLPRHMVVVNSVVALIVQPCEIKLKQFRVGVTSDHVVCNLTK